MNLQDAEETFPFGQDTLVYKSGGKIFAIISLDEPDRCNLKCEPAVAIELRDEYQNSVFPGYHMNKKHWNTVHFNKGLDDQKLIQLITASYNLVSKKASGKRRKSGK